MLHIEDHKIALLYKLALFSIAYNVVLVKVINKHTT